METFHLSPAGNDHWSGRSSRPARNRRDGPWATLAGARDNLRVLRAEGRLTSTATVLVHDGIYELSETVGFGPEDSFTCYVAAPDATPVFDGGERLTGWKVGKRNGRTEWTLDLPEVAQGKRNFRSLFVNGRRAPRARFPKFSPDTAGYQNVLRIGEILEPENTVHFAGRDTFKPKPGDVSPDWASLPSAEFVVLHYWVEERLPKPALNPRTGWVSFARRSAFNLYEALEAAFGERTLARYYIDNLFEALSEPGEWYLNRENGRLHYLPRRGETPANTEVRAPRLYSMVRASGQVYGEAPGRIDLDGTRHVQGLEFSDLTFRHSDWFSPLAERIIPAHSDRRAEGNDLPIGGSTQAASAVSGTLIFRAARDCRVSNCTIERVGLYGIEFGYGCRHCTASGNVLHDLGAGGIRAGGADIDDLNTRRTGNIVITDNHIHHIGRIFHQGIGVLIGIASDCVVAHNHIHDTCYTGISVGWTWGYRDTLSAYHRIEHNLIHHIGAGILSDMGGIYTLGVQPGTVLRGNHLHHIWSQSYGGWGIYLDEGTSHLLVEHNLVHDTKDAPFNIHYGRENVVRHNIFARGEHALASVFRVEDHLSANFFNNILLGPSQLTFCGGYQGDVRHALMSNANCFWAPGGKLAPNGHPGQRPDVPSKFSWSTWKQAGHDQLSIIADPKITEGRGTWRLAKNSPALKLGFQPWDWSKCGGRPKGQRN